MTNERLHTITDWLSKPVSIAPLVTFRLVFGAVMVFSTLRFWYLGWIEEHFIDTQVTFKYFGFEWIQLLLPEAMYLLHALMLLGAIGVWLGLFYRLSAGVFFLTFTYAWLIDLTYYLNHYYFVSIAAFLLILVPAHRRFSVDCWRKPELRQLQTARWTILIFKWQIGIVYIYAGLAKINYDWLIAALPLKIWVPANDNLPLVGPLFRWEYTPWIFSWIGMLYDATIVFWLSWRPTRVLAYLSVIIFHGLTGMMFQIGVFPIVMIGATWIFFSEKFHERLLRFLEQGWPVKISVQKAASPRRIASWTFYLLVAHFALQLLFPWRYLLYPGNMFWTEEGYRFGWRVMLMEKAGTATFYVRDGAGGREGIVFNEDFLSDHQEKQMAMQPDMILQYAHFLEAHYKENGMRDPRVRAEVYVTLNARPSQLLVDPNLDLTTVEDSWAPKKWILPYDKSVDDEQ
ncbi:HTTM domain-containing protein [Flavilitoribacter nigricans]|uniref:HTTM domain-containing protein n=1 Tax=Flavilitoribacter nigricans (strain ATCC 23147 / DSM 23189 / NBRC 102662 / NCIMB 1420 / SS-2) TaxID=1122177 RepID=A0A2D0N5V4_FLAN2|nr:HTTM domain-containing protein [Flavilitoribacter nigricans]PHN03539.1 HTTM domain-containing protein [Flavilitoribacter nigricans DSM 23189 = NBRC 102662]